MDEKLNPLSASTRNTTAGLRSHKQITQNKSNKQPSKEWTIVAEHQERPFYYYCYYYYYYYYLFALGCKDPEG